MKVVVAAKVKGEVRHSEEDRDQKIKTLLVRKTRNVTVRETGYTYRYMLHEEG